MVRGRIKKYLAIIAVAGLIWSSVPAKSFAAVEDAIVHGREPQRNIGLIGSGKPIMISGIGDFLGNLHLDGVEVGQAFGDPELAFTLHQVQDLLTESAGQPIKLEMDGPKRIIELT